MTAPSLRCRSGRSPSRAAELGVRWRSQIPMARSTLKSVPSPEGSDRIITLRIEIAGAKPKIWRRVEVPSDFTLGDLHHVIQYAMGWEAGLETARRLWHKHQDDPQAFIDEIHAMLIEGYSNRRATQQVYLQRKGGRK